MILRALKAVKLLTRIRQERPDLWREITAFANRRDKVELLMDEAERDYRELFAENSRHS